MALGFGSPVTPTEGPCSVVTCAECLTESYGPCVLCGYRQTLDLKRTERLQEAESYTLPGQGDLTGRARG